MAMKQGYSAASILSRKQLDEEDLDGLERSRVVVVEGVYDKGEDVFRTCQIPRSLIRPNQVAGLELGPEQVVFVNCPGHLPPGGLKRLERFVRSGGLLVTTDWALTEVVEKAFPGYVEFNQTRTRDDVVRVEFSSDQEDTFLEGLIDAKEDPLWWLEGASYPIRVLDDSVQVLVSSSEMEQRYGEAPIVVAFEVDAGKVYHLTSHFFLQRTETRTKRHKRTGVAYAKEKGLELDPEEKKVLAACTLGELQSAYTSVRSLTNLVIEQARRTRRRA